MMVKSGIDFFFLKSYCRPLLKIQAERLEWPRKLAATLKGHVRFKNKKFYTIIFFKLKSNKGLLLT